MRAYLITVEQRYYGSEEKHRFNEVIMEHPMEYLTKWKEIENEINNDETTSRGEERVILFWEEIETTKEGFEHLHDLLEE